jgi:hypothetical protein
VLTANVVRAAKAVSAAARAKAVARVAKAASAARLRAASVANAVRVARAAAVKDRAARPSLMAIPEMPRTSRPITPVPAASTRMATSRAARAHPDVRVVRVLRAAVPVVHRVEIVPAVTVALVARAPAAARVQAVLVRVVRVVADAPAADAIPAADRCCYRDISYERRAPMAPFFFAASNRFLYWRMRSRFAHSSHAEKTFR